MRWEELYPDTVRRLGSPAEARWLIEEAAGVGWPRVLDELVTARGARWLEDRLARRVAGEPLQYVLGRWAFRRLELFVDRRVLIPRPETEQLVDVALDVLRSRPARPAGSGAPLVVDLGTGSGAIALSIAAEHAGAVVWATDVSDDALDVARANLAGLGGEAAARVRLAAGDWWDAVPPELAGRIDLVVSNPPYVASAEMGDLDPVVARWEPRRALEAGPDGTDHIGAVLAGAPRWLDRGGAAVVEIAPRQAERVTAMARDAGSYDVRTVADLAGRDRVVVARFGRRAA